MSWNRTRPLASLALGALLAGGAAGCGSPADSTGNLSPTAEQQDPARLERAKKEEEETRRRQEAADKKLFRKMPSPEPGA